MERATRNMPTLEQTGQKVFVGVLAYLPNSVTGMLLMVMMVTVGLSVSYLRVY